jgi:hypothetical protein
MQKDMQDKIKELTQLRITAKDASEKAQKYSLLQQRALDKAEELGVMLKEVMTFCII